MSDRWTRTLGRRHDVRSMDEDTGETSDVRSMDEGTGETSDVRSMDEGTGETSDVRSMDEGTGETSDVGSWVTDEGKKPIGNSGSLGMFFDSFITMATAASMHHKTMNCNGRSMITLKTYLHT